MVFRVTSFLVLLVFLVVFVFSCSFLLLILLVLVFVFLVFMLVFMFVFVLLFLLRLHFLVPEKNKQQNCQQTTKLSTHYYSPFPSSLLKQATEQQHLMHCHSTNLDLSSLPIPKRYTAEVVVGGFPLTKKLFVLFSAHYPTLTLPLSPVGLDLLLLVVIVINDLPFLFGRRVPCGSMLYHYRCHFLTFSLRCTYTRVYGANISVLNVRSRRGTTVHVEFRP